MKAPRALAAASAVAVWSASASASLVSVPFFEGFDDATTDVSFTFNDFPGAASGTGAAGTGPGWTVTGGEAIFYDNSNFGDVGTALVQVDPVPAATDFAVSADFRNQVTDFTTGRYGVLALGIDPTNFNQDFSGIFAYVQENDTSGGNYTFVLANNQNPLQTSASFDLTDGTPDFSIELEGEFQIGGDLLVTATLNTDGGTPIVLSDTIAGGSIPGGNNFGVRLNPGFNTVELGVDNLSVVIPEPGTMALAGLGGLAMLARRRDAR